jgi:hypothetical protein
MKLSALVALLLSPSLYALNCQTFNMQYKFCHEDWVSKALAEIIVERLDQASIQNNVTLKLTSKSDSQVFTFEVRSTEAVNDLSKMPYEMRTEGMKESLGRSYMIPFSALAMDKAQSIKAAASNDSAAANYETWLYKTKFQFQLSNDKGKLVKTYDLTEYVLYGLSEIAGYLKAKKSGEDNPTEEN